ncbi:MAG: MFS transporter [Rhodospirillaceae bacterium]|jgi:MFS transporter, PPP family, 3-phenylpropionic acid transporter|nr:MFS transporter [Rhodospirillaceae bacterium]
MLSTSDPGLSPLNLAIRLSLFYAGYFLVAGVLFPFLPLLLEARGMSPLQISLLMALALWLRAAAGPLVTRHADRTGDSRKPLLACAVASLLVMLAFYWAAGFWVLLLVNIAFFFAYSSIGPLAETISLRTVSAESGYGRVRLWGSVSFVVAAIAGGFALDARGGLPGSTIVTLLLITLAILLLFSFTLPKAQAKSDERAIAPLKTLLSNKPFVLFLVATAMIHAAHGVYYGFSTIHWTSVGYSNSTVGLLWGEGVLAEILLFAFGAPLVRRMGPIGLISAAAALGALRWAVLGLTTELWIVALVQLLHAASFGAMHLGAMLFITRAVPNAYANSAQGLLGGLTYGAGLGGGLLLAGWLYGLYGADAYWSNAALSALALPVVLWLALSWRGKMMTARET